MSDGSRRRAALYWRVLAASLIVAVSVSVTGGIFVSRSWERQARERLTESLATSAKIMLPTVSEALARSPAIPDIQPLAKTLGIEGGCRVTIIEPHGRVLGDSEEALETVGSMQNHAGRPEVRTALAGGTGTSIRRSPTLHYPMMYFAVPVRAQNGTIGVLRLAVPVTTLARASREIRSHVAASLLVGLLVALALSSWLTLRLTRPLSRLARTARAYAAGDFSARTEGAGVREIEQLGEALHSMASSVSGTIDQLTSERNEANVILENLAEGVIAMDGGGRILSMNATARHLLGLDVSGVNGRNLFELVRVRAVREVTREVLDTAHRSERQATVHVPDERTLEVQGLPCGNAGTGRPSAIVVLRDLTEAARYDRLRREFVANVSHELKSPLTSIRGLAETLLEGAIDDEDAARRFVGLIDMDAERLSRLIEDLLSLSQIESQPAAPLGPLDIRPLVESVLERLHSGIERRRLTVALDLPAGVRVLANPDRVRQVLWNLLDNAIKYNRDGGRIAVSASREGEMVRISIVDSGVGIPEQDLARVFERFYRVDKARSRDLGGTGLGLSIVKHIVESHGGTVRVESILDEGSAFSFTLPAAG